MNTLLDPAASRERFFRALEFRSPDKLPVVYHPSPAGLYVHGTKLLELFNRYPADTEGEFTAIPQPPAEAFDSEGKYHEFQRDSWGTLWEYLIFGIQGHPVEYPLASWRDFADFPLPPLPEFAENNSTEKTDGRISMMGFITTLERLCALRPFDEVLMDLCCEDADFLAALDRLADYNARLARRVVDAGPDAIFFGDDFGTQQNVLFAPELFRKIFLPRYREMLAPVRGAGCKVIFHSCGEIRPVLQDLLDLPIDILWPQLSLYGDNREFLDQCADHRVTLLLHPDRQYLIPRGTPSEIERWVARTAEYYHGRGGGGIFYVEIENDAPWENVKALIEAIHKYR